MLKLVLLGTFQAEINNQLLTRFRSDKVRALLAYLSIENERAHRRDSLSALLWTDTPSSKALKNLRGNLYRLKTAFEQGDTALYGQLFDFSNRSVQLLDHDGDLVRVDVLEMQRLFDVCAKHDHEQVLACLDCIERIETAVSLYKGDFLTDFAVPGAFLFEEWVLAQRERYRQLIIDALYLLSEQYEAQRETKKGITAVRKLLTVEPWLESAYRQLMRLLAMDGQRAAALAQYDHCAQLLMEELGVNPSPETDALYDEIESGHYSTINNQPKIENTQSPNLQSPNSPISNPPITQLPFPPFQPPTPIPHFVGREELIFQIQEKLNQGNGPTMVALVGMGGVGKSTLANQLAHQCRDYFVDGVLWADCMATEPIDILESWGRAYGYDFGGLSDLNNRAAAVRGVFAEKKMLIVLDDVSSVANIRPLLPNGQNCVVIITTRNLDIATAVTAHEILLNEFYLEDAIALLEKLLGAKRVENERQAAEKICALLQNLPLAVEIIGQLLKMRRRRKLVDMALRLKEIEQRLGLEINDRAVRTSFEVSWLGLSEPQKRLFRYLAVFEGRPFTGTAVAHIASQNKYDTEDNLFELTSLSLVIEEAENHYRQHTLLADFAHEKLADIGAFDHAFEAMSLYYQELAIRHENDFHTLQPEWGNVMAGLKIAHRQQNWLIVLSYADSLSESWLKHGRFNEMRQAMVWAKEAADSLNNPLALAEVYLKWGEATVEQNEYDQARELLDESLQLYLRFEEGEGIAFANYHLARTDIEQGEYNRAEERLKKSYDIQQLLGNQIDVAAILYRQARILYLTGENEEAEKLLRQILSFQASENRFEIVKTKRLLSNILLIQRNFDEARTHLEEAVELCQEQNDFPELATTLSKLSTVCRLGSPVRLSPTT